MNRLSREGAMIRRARAAEWIMIGLMGLMCLAAAIAWSLRLDPWLGNSGDNARFLLIAESLAQGHGFQFTHNITPVANTLVLPVYPMILAGLMRVLGSQEISEVILSAKALNLLCLFGIATMLFALVRRRTGSRWFALAAGLGVAIHPSLLKYANDVMSEVPYTFLSLLALLAIERWLVLPSSTMRPRRWHVVAVGLITALAYLTRGPGIVLIVAAIYAFWRRGARNDLWLMGALLLLLIGPWQLRAWLLPGQTYTTQLVAEAQRSGNVFVAMALYALETLRFYAKDVAFSYANYLRYHPGWMLAWVGSVAMIGIGWCAGWYRSFEASPGHGRGAPQVAATELYSLLYFLLILIWPWRYERFLVPAVPYLILFWVVGMWQTSQWIGAAISPRGRRIAAALVGLVVMSINVGSVWSHDRWEFREAARAPQERSVERGVAGFREAVGWLKAHGSHEAMVLCIKPYLTRVVTGLRTECLPKCPLELASFLEKTDTDYVMTGPFGSELSDSAAMALEAVIPVKAPYVRLVFTSVQQPSTKIWDLRPQAHYPWLAPRGMISKGIPR